MKSLNFSISEQLRIVNRVAVLSCYNAGIEVVAGWIIGAPNDTIQSLQKELEDFLNLPYTHLMSIF